MYQLASIPSPSSGGFSIGPLFVHAYGLMYVLAVLAAIVVTTKRWEAIGGHRELVQEVALWGFPAGLIGGRIYFDITSWSDVPKHWWGVFAIWDGGMGLWGGMFFGVLGGLIVLKRRHTPIALFLDIAAPGLLCAQAIGRIGNYFNQELFGRPTSLPWGLQIDPANRPDRLRAVLHLPADVPLRVHLGHLTRGRAGLHRAQVEDPPAGAVRALRVGLLRRPHRGRAAARGPRPPHPRNAAQLLGGQRRLPGRPHVVRRGPRAGSADVARQPPAKRFPPANYAKTGTASEAIASISAAARSNSSSERTGVPSKGRSRWISTQERQPPYSSRTFTVTGRGIR